MRKLLLLLAVFATVLTSNSQPSVPDPPGCGSYAVLDMDNDGTVVLQMSVFGQFVYDDFYQTTHFDLTSSYYLTYDVLYQNPGAATYTYTQGSSAANIDTSYHYSGSGPEYVYTDYHYSFNYMGCYFIHLYDPNGDEDGDGILNIDEDINGDGVLQNDDSNGNNVPDYMDPALAMPNFKRTDLSVFPNPASSTISVSGADESATVSIFDLNGRMLKQFPFSSDVNVSDLSSGMYLMQVTSKLKSRAVKFAKR